MAWAHVAKAVTYYCCAAGPGSPGGPGDGPGSPGGGPGGSPQEKKGVLRQGKREKSNENHSVCDKKQSFITFYYFL